MSLQKINVRTIVLILMMVAAAAMRFVSYKFPYLLSDFTPVGAIALFGGAYFTKKWKAYALVLLMLFGSDIFINYLYTSKWVLWYSGSFWIYLTFALMVLIGTFIKNVNLASVGIAAVAAVALHWLITDMPWLYGSLYPHTFAGYIESLNASILFEKNMLLGNIVYGALLFGGFELAKSRYSVLRSKPELAV